MHDYIFLDDFINRPEKDLYNKLKSIHQEVYPNDHKIFIEYNKDIINNLDSFGKYLEILIQNIKLLNISTFFIEIITSHKNISQDLETLCRIYEIEKILSSYSEKNFTVIQDSKNSTFCILPWVHFYFTSDEKILPCCISNKNFDLGTCKDDIPNFNSEKIQKFRKDLLENKEVPQCSICYTKEKNNITSDRIANNFYYKKYINEFLSPTVEPFKMRFLDVKLSNICNMKCRMCSGYYSNKIANEDFKIWGKSEYLNKDKFPKNDELYFKLVNEHYDYLDEISFSGGEPLINNTHYQILDYLLENKKTNVRLSYYTNFSILKHKSQNVLEYWKKFKNITVNASIDLIGNASNYVRNGAEYSTLEKNYFRLKKECEHVNFKINSVLSIYNVFNLCDLQNHWIKNIGINCKQMKFHALIGPNFMSLKCLPMEFKISATKKINEHIDFLSNFEDSEDLINTWKDAIIFMMSDDHSHLLADFFSSNDIRDQFRNQRFENYFLEYKNLRNYAK